MSAIPRFLALAVVLAAAVWTAPAASTAKPDTERVNVTLELANPVVKTGERHTSYLKIGLVGVPEKDAVRAPVNVALVIDRSGSMSGDKIVHAKQAAMMFLDRLAPDDIISVVAYNQNVEVLIPATKITDREELRRRINALQAGGSTALFAGVSKGAAELRKFHNADTVSRVVLVSDGLANVGPSSPDDLAELGTSLGAEGISVSTIGLGLDYNEDLMYRLAAASDGATAFAQEPQDLANFFDREIRAVTHVVATGLRIELKVADGLRPVRVLGDRGTVRGQTVTCDLNQVYGDWENYFIVELDIPAKAEPVAADAAECTVQYRDLLANRDVTARRATQVSFTSDEAKAVAAVNADVIAEAVKLISVEKNREAMRLRDLGQVEEARQALLKNVDFIVQNAAQLPARSQAELQNLATMNESQAGQLNEGQYNATRKDMIQMQQNIDWAIYDK